MASVINLGEAKTSNELVTKMLEIADRVLEDKVPANYAKETNNAVRNIVGIWATHIKYSELKGVIPNIPMLNDNSKKVSKKEAMKMIAEKTGKKNAG